MTQVDRRIIYEQDCESFRYQDRLFWSRFQTLSVLEGAAIWVVFFTGLQGCPLRILAIAASLLVALICIIALKDKMDADNFIVRLEKFEKDMKAYPIKPRKLFKIFSGTLTAEVIFAVVNLFNIYMILFTFDILK